MRGTITALQAGCNQLQRFQLWKLENFRPMTSLNPAPIAMLDSLSNFKGNSGMQFMDICRNFRIGYCWFWALFLVVPGMLAQQAAPPAQPQPESPKTAPAVAPLPQVPAGTGVPVGSGAPQPAKPDSGDTSVTKLGPGDLVEVSVFGVPELNTKARVNNDGDVYLPLIDYVHVGELSIEDAQKVIEKRLDSGGFVRNPHVTIFVNEYASQNVTLLGEVGRPGLYPMVGDRRLFDLFSAAGGLSERASRTVSITRRNKPDQPQLVHLGRNLTDAPESNVDVHPGDTIEVQRAPIVYVVGDVGRPAGLLIDNGSLTVLQAVALSGGPNRTAKLNGTRIVRRSNGPNGMRRLPFR